MTEKHNPGLAPLAEDDPLARRAARYARLTDKAALLNARVDQIVVRVRDGEPGARAALDKAEASLDKAIATLDKAEEGLLDSMTKRGVPAVITGGRVFVNTCFPVPEIPDRPKWIYSYPLPESSDAGRWLSLDQLADSSGHEPGEVLRLEFELTGAEADDARAWLDRTTSPLDGIVDR